jgi:sterol-4alpha-carboxylate 3-dehydrogenase (decarboxylating)
MRTCSLRPAAIYGERDNDLIPNMMRNMRLGRTKTQIGDNTNLFNHTYGGNAADAHLLAAEKLLHAPEGVAREAFFITNGVNLPFWDFSREVFRCAGDTTRPEEVRVISLSIALWLAWAMEWWFWVKGTVPPLDRSIVRFTCMNRYYDISKARERLGYEPKVEWKEGVKRGVEVSVYRPLFFPCAFSTMLDASLLRSQLTYSVSSGFLKMKGRWRAVRRSRVLASSLKNVPSNKPRVADIGGR